MKTTNPSLKGLVLLPALFLLSFSFSNAQESEIPLAVTDLINFSGECGEGKISLDCKLAQDHTLTTVFVERKKGNGSFEHIAEISVTGTRGFHFNDPAAPQGQNLYRLRLVKTHGSYAYSKIIKLDNENISKPSLQVYPTIVTGSATLSISSDHSYRGILQIADMNGRTVHQHTLSVQQGVMVTELQEAAGLKPGSYFVVLSSETQKLVQRIIVQ
jgi:hypothetical protein